jgi:membrane fusion protein, heavy metal efflux system
MNLKYSMIAIAAALTLGSCGKSPESAIAAPSNDVAVTDLVHLSSAQASRMRISTGKVALRAIQGTVQANGVLDVPPQNLVSISAPFGGFLQSTPLLQGSHVTRGQQIAMLQDPEFVSMQQQYLEDRSQLTYLAAEYDRQTMLAAENVNARKSLEKAKADFEGMKARLAGERVRLEMLNLDLNRLDNGEIVKSAPLFAPITGFVTQVNVNIGSHVRPEDILFKIADTGHLHAELTVYERDLPMLEIGQKVRIRISNEREWRLGEIHLIGREIGEDRSVKVHVHLDVEDRELVPGTYLEALIVHAGRDVMALPKAAIVQFEGKANVFLRQAMVADGTDYQMIQVEVGLSDSAYTEVILPAGFDPNGEIVTIGGYELLAKLKNTEGEEE